MWTCNAVSSDTFLCVSLFFSAYSCNIGDIVATQPFAVPWLSGAPTYKLQVFFTQVARLAGGWSSTFYVNTGASNIVAVINGLQAQLYGLTAVNISVPWVRASTIGASRLASTYRFPVAPIAAPSVTNSAVVPGVKLLLALASQLGGFTRQWLGGMPTVWLQNGQLNPASPDFPVLMTFLNYLVANNFYIRKISVQPKTTIQSITAAGLVTAPGHPLAVNTQCYVRIGRMVDGQHANGIWVATPISNTQIQLGPSPLLPFSSAPVPTRTAYITQYGYAGFPIVAPGTLVPPAQNTGLLGATTHKVGRPAYQYSGRRKTRST
jgi:hypothetical protein